ncbi:Tripartite tricarboxylate transporter TctB family protein [Tranquillimonas rosea]|uniref:Tripartite tricarboxylate transporter TctB family protein n=1 Tax=Tranquillimonas rosea TaxID=641238 RepID=A0A1H9VQ62_9RHOB|nr:tripartite tricarboxylate transporter TctB family protein [Tranquillimonas rosea]SES23722.1 Tripartite tricarboxylate transporter TctB family protein [Tranquillimonas rosea]
MSEDDTTKSAEAGDVARLLSYVVIFLASVGLFVEATTIPTSRFEVLGAGSFPKLIYGGLVLLSGAAIFGAVRRLPSGALSRFAPSVPDWFVRRRLVLAVFACLGVYLAALPWIGFSWATFAFLVVLLVILSPRTPFSLGLTLVIALLFSFGLNWLFAEVFNVFLPRGRF